MIDPTTHARRRADLADRLHVPVLLLGNWVRNRNLPDGGVPFRQDSTFLYFTGCDIPGAATLIDDGRCVLYVPRPAADDVLWHGAVAGPDALKDQYHLDEVRWLDDLPNEIPFGTQTLAVPDEARNREASSWTGLPLTFGGRFGSPDLADAVIAMRRTKTPAEVAEIRQAVAVSTRAHRAVWRATLPGGTERGLAALFHAICESSGCTTGYETILTQRGEVLHNHAHDGVLEKGRMLLLDGGAEVASGYTADLTRVCPVGGVWDPRQRAAYDAVLHANRVAIGRVAPGVSYRSIHLASALVIARFLVDEGVLKCSPDTAVETGAHALFYPHGVGHLLGLDVHDLKQFGDRGTYPPNVGRSAQFGLSYLRLNLPLEAGMVFTIEPGFYAIPAILHDPHLRALHRDVVDFDRAERWIGFGGIRIEDDVLCTADGHDVLSDGLPKDADAVAAEVGHGPFPENLWG